MLAIPNIFKTISTQTQKLRGRFTLTAILYAVVGLVFFTTGVTATNAYVTGETPKEFLTRITSGVWRIGEEQETLVLGTVVEDGEEEVAPAEEVENEEHEPADTTPSPAVAQVGTAPTTPATEPADTTGDTTAAEPAPEEQNDSENSSNDAGAGEQDSDAQDDTQDEPQQPDPTPTPTPEPEPTDSPEMASLAEYILKAISFLNEADGFIERYSQTLNRLVNNERYLAAIFQHLESDLSDFWVRVGVSTGYLIWEPTTDEADEYAHSFRDHMKSWRDRLAQIVRVSESYSMLGPLSEDEIDKLLDYVDGPQGQEADLHYAVAEADLNMMVTILEAYCIENSQDQICE